jgi:hypothetical protein
MNDEELFGVLANHTAPTTVAATTPTDESTGEKNNDDSDNVLI